MPVSVSVRRSLRRVLYRIEDAAHQRQVGGEMPRLVAVSKKKSVDHIVAAYEYGQRHFGENYVPELVEKARDPRILSGSPEILWHYIGSLRRQQCKLVAALPNLWMVETVGANDVAKALNGAWRNQRHSTDRDLRVMVQVNTSSEPNKSGCDIENCTQIVEHILKACDHLKFSGLMTIGAAENSFRCQKDPTCNNPDFDVLGELKEKVCKVHALGKDEVDLSMGMTADMETAIRSGSTNIRVGTAIFGSREDSIYASESEPDAAESRLPGLPLSFAT